MNYCTENWTPTRGGGEERCHLDPKIKLNPLNYSGNYVCTACFNNQKICILPAVFIYGFHTILGISSMYTYFLNSIDRLAFVIDRQCAVFLWRVVSSVGVYRLI
jgi:hypothetical protein